MKYHEKGKEKEKEKRKILPSEEEKEGKECPNCHFINETEAKFCAECGYDLSTGEKCPKCGAKIVSPYADICEVCGEWLLEGKCKFCYADLEEGATYCAECGNPVAGIICPQCGRLSYFDFCKFCNTPLTHIAYKMIERVKANPEEKIEKFTTNQEARAYFMAQKFVMMGVEVKEKKEEDKAEELLKMKEYIEKVKKKQKKKTYTPLFSEKQIQDILSSGKEAEKEIQRQEEERRRKEEERRRRQEEERRRRLRGWVCYCCHVLHSSPADCGCPYAGGYWVDWI